jgi:hypothetical protein
MYLSADVKFLGLYTPTPKPEIVSLTSNCFETPSGMISAKIKNNGESGQINIYAECTSGFSASRQDIYLNSGSTSMVTLSLSGSGTLAKNLGSCKVYAEALGTKVSKDVQTCVTIPKICIPNSERCSEKNIMTCDSQGLSEKVTRTCPTSCFVKECMAQCEEQPVECTTDEFCMAQNYDKASPCKLWECKKSAFSTDVCAPKESEAKECKVDACNKTIKLGGFIIFPDLSEKCFESKMSELPIVHTKYRGATYYYYIIQIGIYFLSLFLLWLPISELLKKLGLKGRGKKAEGVDIFRIALSVIVGWFVSVLIWSLLMAFIILAVIFVIGAIAVRAIKSKIPFVK